MEIVNKITQFCVGCMNIHELKVVNIQETEMYKDKLVNFTAEYNYCETSDMLIEDEEQIINNFKKMKNQ